MKHCKSLLKYHCVICGLATESIIEHYKYNAFFVVKLTNILIKTVSAVSNDIQCYYQYGMISK